MFRRIFDLIFGTLFLFLFLVSVVIVFEFQSGPIYLANKSRVKGKVFGSKFCRRW